MAKEYITRKELAKRLGVTPEAIIKAEKIGRVIRIKSGKNKGLYDWKKNKKSFTEDTRRPDVTFKASRKTDDDEFKPKMTRVEAESVKQLYLAKQAKLKYLKEVGELIEVSKVKKAWEDIAIRVHKALFAIPDRVSDIFASINDSNKIHQELEKEIRYALTNLQYEVGDEDEN